MPRSRLVVRPAVLTTHIPEDLMAKLKLHLYSSVLGRIPQGAISQFFSDRIREYFDKAQKKCPHCKGDL